MNQLIKAAADGSVTLHTDGKSIQLKSANQEIVEKNNFISRATKKEGRGEKGVTKVLFLELGSCSRISALRFWERTAEGGGELW